MLLEQVLGKSKTVIESSNHCLLSGRCDEIVRGQAPWRWLVLCLFLRGISSSWLPFPLTLQVRSVTTAWEGGGMLVLFQKFTCDRKCDWLDQGSPPTAYRAWTSNVDEPSGHLAAGGLRLCPEWMAAMSSVSSQSCWIFLRCQIWTSIYNYLDQKYWVLTQYFIKLGEALVWSFLCSVSVLLPSSFWVAGEASLTWGGWGLPLWSPAQPSLVRSFRTSPLAGLRDEFGSQLASVSKFIL